MTPPTHDEQNREAAVATLSESESKALVERYGVPVVPEALCDDQESAADAADRLGYPVVAKLCGDSIAHKTERGLVRLRLSSRSDVIEACGYLLNQRRPGEEDARLLIAPMVAGSRELICGVHRDDNFGALVMLGIGGVLTEALDDAVMGMCPLTRDDARSMIDRLRTQRLLDANRGEPAVDRERLADILVSLSDLAQAHPEIVSVDLNPVIISNGAPVAVDALVVQTTVSSSDSATVAVAESTESHRYTRKQFDALFDPKGIVVAGASSHPGKFGFVTLHNIRAAGFQGSVFATKLDGADVLGAPTYTSLAEIPGGECDLLVICTPASTVAEMLPIAAEKGISAVFMTSAGYAEAGAEGAAAQAELVRHCRTLGILLAGPNGQGVVSPPAKLCAQIVGPNPPTGSIAVVSQSGNLVSSFLNHATRSNIGVSRAVSAGNAAATGVIDFLEYFAADTATAVSITYLEGVVDGRQFYERLSAIAPRKPVVVVKGGSTEAGARAAASHTGSLASDDRVIDAMLFQSGALRVSGVEAAFDLAASFATLPLPDGGRTAVVTTVGGWGVLASDAIARSQYLCLATLDSSTFAAIDELLPPRWSRNNPIDMAGGETRDSVPAILELLARSDEVDAIVFLGVGIQSNQAQLMRNGPLYPDFGLERIVSYHERQDRRYVDAVADLIERHNKPIFVATELVATNPDNPGPARLREIGLYGYSSAERAVRSLDRMVEFSNRRNGGPK